TLLVAPTTPPDRAAQIARASTGFVYLLARVGLTGQSSAALDAPALRTRIDALRRATNLPIACGFGITTAADVKSVVGAGAADAAIVGSALVRAMADSHQTGKPIPAQASFFIESLRSGLV
ncbi:MAG TPA: tryptophan synthase subunit alpha, partial [Phycisphaerales bacterium]|nr:tryptophan synthase subunit alpha [Phycisphaerales bacterium]